MALGIELGFEIQDHVGIGGGCQLGGGVVRLEGRQDVVWLISEVDHVGGALFGVAAIQSRKGLHGLDAA